jgi:alpha-glucuronidase
MIEKAANQYCDPSPQLEFEVFENVESRLKTQHKEALWWRDASVLYFQKYSKMPILAPYEKPSRTFEEIKDLVDVYHVK